MTTATPDPFTVRPAPDLSALDPDTRADLQRLSETMDRTLRLRLEQGRPRRQAPPTADQAMPPLPEGVDPVHGPYRPQRRDEMQTQAGREALAQLLATEQIVAGAIRREAEARRAVLADVNLAEHRRTPRMQEEAGKVVVGLLPTIRGVDELHRRAQGAADRMAEARRSHNVNLPPASIGRRSDITNALLGLGDAERTRVVMDALAEGDLPVLGAIASWPLCLGRALPLHGALVMPRAREVGMPAEVAANRLSHEAIVYEFERLIAPEVAQERDELALLATGAATLMSWTLSTLVEQSGADPYSDPTVHSSVAGWQANGLDRWGPRDLLAMRTWRQRAAAAGS